MAIGCNFGGHRLPMPVNSRIVAAAAALGLSPPLPQPQESFHKKNYQKYVSTMSMVTFFRISSTGCHEKTLCCVCGCCSGVHASVAAAALKPSPQVVPLVQCEYVESCAGNFPDHGSMLISSATIMTMTV
jgi:hypothetical protein